MIDEALFFVSAQRLATAFGLLKCQLDNAVAAIAQPLTVGVEVIFSATLAITNINNGSVRNSRLSSGLAAAAGDE